MGVRGQHPGEVHQGRDGGLRRQDQFGTEADIEALDQENEMDATNDPVEDQ